MPEREKHIRARGAQSPLLESVFLVFHETAAACQVCADRTLKHASVICLHFFASPCCFQHAKNHQNSEILSRGCRKRDENVFPVSNHLLILPVLKKRIY